MTAARNAERERPQPFLKTEDLLMMPGWFFKKAALSLLPARTVISFAASYGALLARTAHKRRRIKRRIARQYGLAVNDPYVDKVCRRNLQFLEVYRWLRVITKPEHFSEGQAIVTGAEHLREALSRGRGAMLLTTHYGYDKTLKPILRASGFDSQTLGSKRLTAHERLSRVGEFVYFRLLRMPSSYRADAVDIAAGFNPRPLVEALRKNQLVQIAVDGKESVQRIRVETFGGQQGFAAGPVSVAQKTGAPLLPTFGVAPLDGPVWPQVLVLPPLRLFSDDGSPRSPEEVIADFGAAYREVAEAHPHLVEWRSIEGRTGKKRPPKKGSQTGEAG